MCIALRPGSRVVESSLILEVLGFEEERHA